MDKHW